MASSNRYRNRIGPKVGSYSAEIPLYLQRCNERKGSADKLNICVVFEASEGYDHRSRITHIFMMIGIVAKGDAAGSRRSGHDRQAMPSPYSPRISRSSEPPISAHPTAPLS